MSRDDTTRPATKQNPRQSRMFASLANPNYRLWFVGALISNVGTWMGRVAQDWLVLTELTEHSSVALGTVTGLQFLPILLLAPWAGAFADRFPKRKILMVTQAALAITAFITFLLVATNTAQLWQIYALATLQGVATAFDNPTRQAFASEIVDVSMLANAVALNSASFNAARLIGPGVAGLIIGAWGVAPTLLVNTFSFVAVLIALRMMNAETLHPAPQRRGRGAIREGIAYVAHRPDIQVVMFMVFMLGTFGMNFQITNALMATMVFHKGAEEYGILGSIMAIGSLSAALMAARRARPRLMILVGALAGFAIATTGLGLAPSYTLYAILLIPTGLCALTVMTTANSTVQLAVDPVMRGRVMALYMAIFLGGTPLGAPIIGWIGAAFGPRWTILVGAIATGLTVLITLWWLRRIDKNKALPSPKESLTAEPDDGPQARAA